MKSLKNILISGVLIASTLLPVQGNAQVKTSDYNPVPAIQVADWKEGRPYWDMPAAQDSTQSLFKSNKTSEHQFNAYHQPNEIYGKETSHGGGDYDGFGIGQSDQDAAQAGTDHYALDVTGDNIINGEDATEIGNLRDNLIPYLQSNWNFSLKNEKLPWFTKMANIYTVDQKQYIDGDETTRYVSGNYATEFILRLQGYNKNLADLLGGTRKDIPSKYNESLGLNGRGNIPVYFVNRVRYDDNGNVLGGHGMVGLLIGDNPLEINDWVWYEPQLNQIFHPGNLEDIFPSNSSINVYKLENFGGSSWGEDMPSRFLGDASIENSTQLIDFGIDSSGNTSVNWSNPYLLTTKPTVGIKDEKNFKTSNNYSFEKIYPNPTNSEANIIYHLPTERSNISVSVVDMLGREVNTFKEGWQESGEHKIKWNANNYSSGVYNIILKDKDQILKKGQITIVK